MMIVYIDIMILLCSWNGIALLRRRIALLGLENELESTNVFIVSRSCRLSKHIVHTLLSHWNPHSPSIRRRRGYNTTRRRRKPSFGQLLTGFDALDNPNLNTISKQAIKPPNTHLAERRKRPRREMDVPFNINILDPLPKPARF